MKDQSNGALNPTKTGTASPPMTSPIHLLNCRIPSAGSVPLSCKSDIDNPVTSSAFGSAFILIGRNSRVKVKSGDSTEHAPRDNMLNSPGIGPAASISTDIKRSFFIFTTLADRPAQG